MIRRKSKLNNSHAFGQKAETVGNEKVKAASCTVEGEFISEFLLREDNHDEIRVCGEDPIPARSRSSAGISRGSRGS